MTDTPPSLDIGQSMKDVANQNLLAESKVYANLGQEIIVTTEDKIRLCLLQHLSRMDRKRAWITPLAIFLTIVVIFPTTTFHDFMFISADTWKALFMLSGIVSFMWFLLAVRDSMITSSLDNVIAEIKKISIPEKIE